MKIREWMNGLKLNIKFTVVIVSFVIVPIVILAAVLFNNMENNVINENVNYMKYTMERNRDSIETSINSINMVTQFFLSDSVLSEVLKSSVQGSEMSAAELIQYYGTGIAALERLVNNNPLLYGVRVYAINDSVQEMMPILYRQSRMQKLDWALKSDYVGWNYDYMDTIFSGYSTDKNRRLVSQVTLIEDYEYGTIGYIEAAMTMETMFPTLYEGVEQEWSCFVSADGSIYFGDNEQQESQALIEDMLAEGLKTDGIYTYDRKYGRRSLIISYLYLKEPGGTLICVQDITQRLSQVYQMRYIFIAAMILLTIVLVFLTNFTVKRLLSQFYDILKSIRTVQQGNLDVVIENCGSDEMGELGSQINTMLERIRRLMEDNINRELLAKDSEIRALQNQINAHFIYNVLESIKMMAEINEEYAISDAITSLGKLLRYSMRWVSGNVRVEEELEYIKDYLTLINLRFDYEIYLSLNIPEEIRRQEIPKMSLQPIVENAIYHGIEQMAEDTNIYIKGKYDGPDCLIEITDAGRGMTEEEVKRLEKKIAGEIETCGGSGNGIGLKNVQDRIRMAFGEKYGIGIASKLGLYTKIIVRIPLKRNLEGNNK